MDFCLYRMHGSNVVTKRLAVNRTASECPRRCTVTRVQSPIPTHAGVIATTNFSLQSNPRLVGLGLGLGLPRVISNSVIFLHQRSEVRRCDNNQFYLQLSTDRRRS